MRYAHPDELSPIDGVLGLAAGDVVRFVEYAEGGHVRSHHGVIRAFRRHRDTGDLYAEIDAGGRTQFLVVTCLFNPEWTPELVEAFLEDSLG